MEHARKSGRFGMSAKLNLLLIVGILLISIGLMQITYLIYRRKVDSLYFEQATSAAKDVVNEHLPYQLTSYLREKTDTDEFREVRSRAASLNDEQIIEDWMRAQPPTPYLAEYYAENESTIKYKERYTLFGDYQELKDELTEAMHAQGIDKIYLQYVVDGVTYSLVEPGESLLLIGTAKEPIDALTQYGINDAIPPTIYQYGGNWLCTAYPPGDGRQHAADQETGHKAAETADRSGHGLCHGGRASPRRTSLSCPFIPMTRSAICIMRYDSCRNAL